MLCFDLPFRKDKIDLLQKHFASLKQIRVRNDFPKLMHVEDASEKVCHHVTSQILWHEGGKSQILWHEGGKNKSLVFLSTLKLFC